MGSKTKTKDELIAHATNLGLQVGPRMTNEALEQLIAKAEKAAEKGTPISNATPMPDPPVVEEAVLTPLNIKVPTPAERLEASQASKRWRAISWLTCSSMPDKQVSPGDIIELSDAEAKHFLKVGGAIEPV